MIQDIKPYFYDNQYVNIEPEDDDRVIIIKDRTLVIKVEDGTAVDFPRWRDVKAACCDICEENAEVTYLFAIRKEGDVGIEGTEVNRFFGFDGQTAMAAADRLLADGYETSNQRGIQMFEPSWLGFAGTTAFQIISWYRENKFCGCCGKPMKRSGRERMVYCEDCKVNIYPRINPVVIVAVTNGDRLLLTQYAHGAYKRYALVAGFGEVGETIEETVAREVYEETGVRVKNLQFYKSQPWSLSNSLLFGFFCELDGSEEVSLNDGELALAEWVHRDDIPDYGDKVSLTQEMIMKFKYDR